MTEEYIKSSKACAFILGSSTNTAALFDFGGVYILDGGFAEKTPGFMAHVRSVDAVLLSAPTKNNLGTSGALLEQNNPLPVFTNTKPLKTAKAGSSGEQVKAIQEANSKLLFVEPPVFSPKYQPYVLNRCAVKGMVSLYILAGDAKDAEALTKALASGNEAEVEKAAAEHGTIGVLLCRPALADKPAIRVLISGTSSMARIQQSLDKAAKALPFLNAPVVKSKDALTDIPAPSSSVPAKTATGKPLARPAPSSGTRPAATAASARVPLRSAPPTATSTRPPVKAPAPRTAPTAKAPIVKAAAPAARARPTPAAPSAAAKKPAAPGARSAPSALTARSTETVAVKKTVGKVQGAAPSKPATGAPAVKKTSTPAPVAAPKASEPSKKPSPPPSVAPVVPAVPVISAPEVVVDLDDSVICLSDLNQGGSGEPDIVIIPPTPEPPRHEGEPKEAKKEPQPPVENVVGDVEPEIPPPVDAFKKPDPEPCEDSKHEEKPAPPVYPILDDVVPAVTPSLIDVDPIAPVAPAAPAEPSQVDTDPIAPSHPEPSAPVVPADHVIISQDDPALPDIAAAVPFVPHVKPEDDGLITLDDDKDHVAPGFEEPLIPQSPREDGTLADCSEEVSKLIEISMDTDKLNAEADTTKPIGEVTQLVSDFKNLELDEKTDEYVRKISNQMIEEATLPFTSALANTIAGVDTIVSNGVNGTTEEKPLVGFDNSRSNGQQQQHEEPKEASKHDLMQSRSSVIENGAPIQYEQTDPAIDDILAACAHESEKVDAAVAAHSETLHMPERPGVVAASKPVKFSRPYYFDVVTVPRNEKIETTLNAEGLTEFVSKIRSRNLILPSKNISSEQLEAMLAGKRTWCDSTHPCNIVPTHSSSALTEFCQKQEEQFSTIFLTVGRPVDKLRTTVSSEAEPQAYELARISLE